MSSAQLCAYSDGLGQQDSRDDDDHEDEDEDEAENEDEGDEDADEDEDERRWLGRGWDEGCCDFGLSRAMLILRAFTDMCTAEIFTTVRHSSPLYRDVWEESMGRWDLCCESESGQPWYGWQ